VRIKEILEGLKDPKDNPCWKGYYPVGTKKKNGKTVPNCVPEAANPAQQAAIAINMKKHGKKPKDDMDEASGHIPVNDEEANDPRWSNALTVDIKPGEDKKQAAKMGFKVSNSGPPKLQANGKI